MEVGHRDSGGQGGKVRMLLRHVRTGLSCQSVNLHRADAIVKASNAKTSGYV